VKQRALVFWKAVLYNRYKRKPLNYQGFSFINYISCKTFAKNLKKVLRFLANVL
jgi:hypothetical protein